MTTTIATTATLVDEKTELGNSLFIKVCDIAGTFFAPKVTGMLLDGIPVAELRQRMNDEQSLQLLVQEALDVLSPKEEI
jgi:hypothetical protein